MKKSSSTIDYFMVSNDLAGRMGQVKANHSSYIATHRPVSMAMACAAHHVENKVRMPMKFPAQPLSSTGPFNRPADWTAAEAALDRAILAAQRAVKQEWAFDYTNGKQDYKVKAQNWDHSPGLKAQILDHSPEPKAQKLDHSPEPKAQNWDHSPGPKVQNLDHSPEPKA